MRLATVEHHRRPAAAVITADESVRLPAVLSAAAAVTGTELGLDEVRLMPPLQPPSVRDFVAFEEHVAGVVKSVTSQAAVPDE